MARITQAAPRRPKAPLWVFVAGVLLVHALLLVDQARRNAPAFDELIYAPAGYATLTHGDQSLNPEHPPALKLLMGASWLGAGVDARAVGGRQHPFLVGQQLLYESATPAMSLLLRARLVMGALSLVTALAVFLFARRLGGATAGLVALGLYTLDPLVLGHGSLATLDVGAAACFFLAASALGWGLARGWLGATVAGLSLGLALASKASTLPLLVGALGLVLWAWSTARGARGRLLAQGLVALAAAALVLALVCLPGGPRVFWQALALQGEHARQGHAAFAFGLFSRQGWWWYYPGAWLVKTPIPALVLTAAGVVGLAVYTRREPRLMLPHVLSAATLLSFTLAGTVAIGVRNLLPVVPLLCVGGGLMGERLWHEGQRWRWLLPALLLWLAGGTWRAHPCELSFFNEAAGGSAAGPRLLTDSNLDWGTDLGRVAPIVDRQPLKRLYLVYFGSARPAAHGLPRYRWMPAYNFAPELALDGPDPNGREWIAISATALTGVYPPGREAYAWLHERTPTARAGAGILLFDITGDGEAHGRMGLAALRAGFPAPAVAALERAVELAPRDRNALAALVAAHLRRGDRAAAARLCGDARGLVPTGLCQLAAAPAEPP